MSVQHDMATIPKDQRPDWWPEHRETPSILIYVKDWELRILRDWGDCAHMTVIKISPRSLLRFVWCSWRGHDPSISSLRCNACTLGIRRGMKLRPVSVETT